MMAKCHVVEMIMNYSRTIITVRTLKRLAKKARKLMKFDYATYSLKTCVSKRGRSPFNAVNSRVYDAREVRLVNEVLQIQGNMAGTGRTGGGIIIIIIKIIVITTITLIIIIIIVIIIIIIIIIINFTYIASISLTVQGALQKMYLNSKKSNNYIYKYEK